jgi:hypothetical protein
MLTVGIGLAATLVGCSDSGSTASPAPASPAPAAPTSSAGIPANAEAAAWLNQFCGVIGTTPPASDPTAEQPTDPAGVRKALDKLSGDLKGFFTSKVDSLNKLPKSPIPSGDEVKKKMVDVFQSALEQAKNAQVKLDASAVNDPQAVTAFSDALKAVEAKLGDTGKSMDTLPDSPELQSASQNAPNCKKLAS